jgi:hypothetical protein
MSIGHVVIGAAAAMKSASPELMAAYREETKLWDVTSGDGLEEW